MAIFDRLGIKVIAGVGLCGAAMALSPDAAATSLKTGGYSCVQGIAGDTAPAAVAGGPVVAPVCVPPAPAGAALSGASGPAAAAPVPAGAPAGAPVPAGAGAPLPVGAPVPAGAGAPAPVGAPVGLPVGAPVIAGAPAPGALYSLAWVALRVRMRRLVRRRLAVLRPVSRLCQALWSRRRLRLRPRSIGYGPLR